MLQKMLIQPPLKQLCVNPTCTAETISCTWNLPPGPFIIKALCIKDDKWWNHMSCSTYTSNNSHLALITGSSATHLLLTSLSQSLVVGDLTAFRSSRHCKSDLGYPSTCSSAGHTSTYQNNQSLFPHSYNPL